MIEVYPDTFAYFHILIMIIAILSFELVLYSLKENIAYTRSMTVYKVYFGFAIFAWSAQSISEIIYNHVDLNAASLFYSIASYLLFLAFSEKEIKSKSSISIIFLSTIFIILLFMFSHNHEKLMIISIYGFLIHFYLFYIGIQKTLAFKNMGYALMSSGFVLVTISSLYQIYYLQSMGDINLVYSIAKVNTSIGFILVGIGLLASILIIEHKHLRSQTFKDPLTGMYNRRGLDHLLQLIVPAVKRNKKPISAITVDIDFFKKINDTYGHDGGDIVLQNFAQMIQTCPRASDLSARLGGEEFVVILPETTLEGALTVAEKIRQKVEELHINYEEHIIELTSSFGVASQSEIIDIDALLKNADKALYKAKEEGRNRVCHLES